MVDITTLKDQAGDLLESKELADQANLAKSQLLALMSHEIRTPTNGVIGMASLLFESGLGGEQKDYAETIAKSGGDLVVIINDILDFSKVEAGQLDIENTEFGFVECIESAIDLNTMRAAEKGLELLLDGDAELPEIVVGDTTRLRQVLIDCRIQSNLPMTEECNSRSRLPSIWKGWLRFVLKLVIRELASRKITLPGSLSPSHKPMPPPVDVTEESVLGWRSVSAFSN